MARKQPDRSAQSRAAMIEAAIDLIAEGGLRRATMVRIGERSGYSHGLADYHFGSKAELVEEVIIKISSEWSKSISAKPGTDPSAMQSLARVVITYMQRLEDDYRTFKALYVLDAEALSVAPEVRTQLATHDAAFRKRLTVWITQARDSGYIRADIEPKVAAVVLAGLLRGVAFQWLLDQNAFLPTSTVPMILELVFTSWAKVSSFVLENERNGDLVI